MAVPEYTVINLKESPETVMDCQVRTYIGVTRDSTVNLEPFNRKGIAPKGYLNVRFERVILECRGIEPNTIHKERRAQLIRLGVGRRDCISKLIPEGSLDGLEEICAYSLPEDGLTFIVDCHDRAIENTKKVLNLIGTLYPKDRFTKRYHHIQKKLTVKNNRYHWPQPKKLYGDIFHRENVLGLTVIPG